jgi:UDP-perosamine 4-acetyltransferase
MERKLPVVVLGGGGHAKVLLDVLCLTGVPVLGISLPDGQGTVPGPYPVIPGDDEVFARFAPDEVRLVNAVGSVGPSPHRQRLFERFKAGGFTFATLIHPSAVVAGDVEISEGAQIMAGAVIQPGCKIGRNAIVNTRASVDHDVAVGDHAHVSPGAVLCGGVSIGSGTHVGAGAVIIQNVRVGSGSLIAAGSVVVRDVPDHTTVMGIPAKEVSRHEKMD